MSEPIFIKIAASTQSGISATNPENLYNSINNTMELVSAAIFVLAPVLSAATVLIVAAAPGREPVNPQRALPSPCDATRSLGDICVFVIELQTSPVNKVSEVKMIASVIP